MELEKAIKILKKEIEPKENRIVMELDIQAIETVLKALEKYYQEGYIKGRKEEEQEMIKVIKNHYIDKKKIEDKIKDLIQKENYRTKDNPNGRIHFQIEPCDYQIQILKELLEDKAEIDNVKNKK